MKVLASDKIAEIGLLMFKNAGIEAEMKTGLSEDEIVKIPDLVDEHNRKGRGWRRQC